ncbi:putative UDP-glucuronosyl/UDP-glucosyltransferase [Rosa chinensis]|uniref:Putative UDP-glucuronosyl/UDP-glucosyltransferase n=1 Tax=Rosa chinensis TaxID=74649 RepID=A0A2P6PK13_ROSCH|nr:putative UDP-glucuronosyl/UDP-glucosyltransferase [Rosa chinensis]
MEKEHRAYKSHCLVLPYPSQGHINPLFQFSKLLDHKQIKVTLVTTRFTSKTMHRGSSGIELETISDGYDEGWRDKAESIQAYIERFWQVGPETLTELLEKLSSSGCPVDCIVYDSVMPWALDVAKKFGIVGAAFFTQSCVVDNIYYHVNKGLLKLPLSESETSLPGMPPLRPVDFPSFMYDLGSYPAYFDVVLGQFSNV